MRTNDFAMNAKAEGDRLETPVTAGYRTGMSSSSMIGRRLGRMYEPAGEVPREIGDALQVLARKMYRPG